MWLWHGNLASLSFLFLMPELGVPQLPPEHAQAPVVLEEEVLEPRAGVTLSPAGALPRYRGGEFLEKPHLNPRPRLCHSEAPSLRNQSPLPRCALCIWLSQPSPGTGPACWARSAVCGFVLAWVGAERARPAWDGVGGSVGTEVSCRALQTPAENWGENSLRHASSL